MEDEVKRWMKKRGCWKKRRNEGLKNVKGLLGGSLCGFFKWERISGQERGKGKMHISMQ